MRMTGSKLLAEARTTHEAHLAGQTQPGIGQLGPAGRLYNQRHPIKARNADGRLKAFARGSDNALWHVWQVVPMAAGPAGVLGRIITSGRRGNAMRMTARSLRARHGQYALWHNWQVVPNGGCPRGSLGGIITSDPVSTKCRRPARGLRRAWTTGYAQTGRWPKWRMVWLGLLGRNHHQRYKLGRNTEAGSRSFAPPGRRAMATTGRWPLMRMSALGFLRWLCDLSIRPLASERFERTRETSRTGPGGASANARPLPGTGRCGCIKTTWPCSRKVRRNWSGQPGCQKLERESGGGPACPGLFGRGNSA